MTKIDRFLNIYGWISIGLFAGCLYTIHVISLNDLLLGVMGYSGIAITILYLVTGIGILARKLWGYYLLKIFLWMIFLAFPIGTFISFKSLKFMKRNSVKEAFST